jgi:hypothetical protein
MKGIRAIGDAHAKTRAAVAGELGLESACLRTDEQLGGLQYFLDGRHDLPFDRVKLGGQVDKTNLHRAGVRCVVDGHGFGQTLMDLA